ncbi:MAG: polyprenyl synthetase family protein [Crenarchaeota archaeon]|nr:polyprenyl synthetase family protein [Thermoproteota archaeon]
MKALGNVFSEVLSRYSSHVDEKLEDYLTRLCSREFVEVVLYQVKTGGKRIRPVMTLLFAEALGQDWRKALPESCIVELIHEYSLIFDDIIDHSTVRRGKPTLWKEHGTNFAILAGLWYREAIEEAILESIDPTLVAKLASETMRDIIEGERLDILLEATGREDPYYRKNRIIDRLDRDNIENIYLKMIRKKTASLFRLSCMLGALSARRRVDEYVEAAATYGENVGIAFQLIDDLLDIYGEFEKFGKEIGKDIKEHKLGNAVIVNILRRGDERDVKVVLEVLSKEKVEDSDIRRVIEIADKYDSRKAVLDRASKYAERAVAALERFPENEFKRKLIDIAKFVVYREY